MTTTPTDADYGRAFIECRSLGTSISAAQLRHAVNRRAAEIAASPTINSPAIDSKLIGHEPAEGGGVDALLALPEKFRAIARGDHRDGDEFTANRVEACADELDAALLAAGVRRG